MCYVEEGEGRSGRANPDIQTAAQYNLQICPAVVSVVWSVHWLYAALYSLYTSTLHLPVHCRTRGSSSHCTTDRTREEQITSSHLSVSAELSSRDERWERY